MRILTIVFGLGPGGTQRSAENCTTAYLERGHDVAVLAYREGGPRQANLQSRGVPVFVGGTSEDVVNRATDEAAAWNPDVIHVHRAGLPHPRSAGILRRIKGATAGRVAVLETNHFSRVDDSPDRELIDVHMQLSKWCMWKWRQWSRDLRPQPIGAVVPHIIDGSSFYPADDATRRAFRAGNGIPEDAFVFGRIGQAHKSKWSPLAFRAFETVASRHPEAWWLTVGMPPAYQPLIDRLPDAIRRRVVQIEFLHGDEPIRACYAGMDVFLHSAQIGESFGMVLAEAMLCERPVITACTPAHDNTQLEVVGHDRGGLVACDRASMVVAMERLMTDAALRERLAGTGRAWCLEQYDADRIATIMLRIAEHAVGTADHAELAAALDDDPIVDTSGSWSEIRQLLDDAIGAPPWRARALMRLVHSPLAYKAIRLARKVVPPR